MIVESFEHFVFENNVCDEAASQMYDFCNNDPKLLRRFYLSAFRLLTTKFGDSEVYNAIHLFAGFDIDHEHHWVQRSAKAFVQRYERFLCRPRFIEELQKYGIAGFDAGDLLYVATRCVKPDSLTYQVTVFAKGMGPLGDTQHQCARNILLNDARGAGIPSSAKFLTKEQLMGIERHFMPTLQR